MKPKPKPKRAIKKNNIVVEDVKPVVVESEPVEEVEPETKKYANFRNGGM